MSNQTIKKSRKATTQEITQKPSFKEKTASDLKKIFHKLQKLEIGQEEANKKMDRIIKLLENNSRSSTKKEKNRSKSTSTSFINQEILPKNTKHKIKRIELYLNKYWKLFLPKKYSRQEQVSLIKLIKHPTFKAFNLIEKQLTKDENNQIFAPSAKEIDEQLHQLIKNEIFELLEMRFTEIVYFHQQLDSNRAKSKAELDNKRNELMQFFGIEKIPVQIGEDIFSNDIHAEFEQNRDETKQDGAILSVLNDGYRYGETDEILKKVEVTVNYRY